MTGDHRVPSGVRSRAAMLAALALVASFSTAPGCAFAVEHPAVTAGTVAGTLGFGTCKLASDDYAACGLVGGGAFAFLALITAVASWLGGDGHTVMTEEQAQPIPDDGRPRTRRPRAPADPAARPAAPAPAPAGASPEPAGPPPADAPAAPASPPPSPPAPPANPPPANPDPQHIKSP